MSRTPRIETVSDHLGWSYANLARADAALQKGCSSYNRTHDIIRTRLFYGLKKGTMKVRSLYYDERIKMKVPQACCYCGATSSLSIDHLIPRICNGNDESSNLIWACRSCNSSKQGRDMLDWMKRKDRFPAVLLLRRYLKLVLRYCDEHDLMAVSLPEALERELPFELSLIPHEFPPLNELTLWVYPGDLETDRISDSRQVRLK